MVRTNSNIKVDDYRDIKPYYELIFKIMATFTLSYASGETDKFGRPQPIVDALRALTGNTSPYLKEPLTTLKNIEEQYLKLYDQKYLVNNMPIPPQQMTAVNRKEYYQDLDSFNKFAMSLYMVILVSLSRSGILPKSFVEQEQVIVEHMRDVRA